MKKTFKTLSRAARAVVIGIGVAVCAAAAVPSLHAQAATPKVYTLTASPVGTNTATFAATNALTIPASTVSNILSTPFPMYRDRGFAGNYGYYSTNLATVAPSFVFQFATPVKLSGAWVTNWDNSPFVTNTGVACNGTNEVYCTVMNAGTTIQNVALGRLYSIITASGAPCIFDPTNTFVGIIP